MLCPQRTHCTKAKREPRIIYLQTQEQHEALQRARQEQQTEAFRLQYAARAGIEGTHEQALRRCGLRYCRYIGAAKARLQHVISAAAINLMRINDWWTSTPRARTRQSRFAALEPLPLVA
jgi:transposase